MIALAKFYRKSKLSRFTLASCAHVVERLLAVDLRLPGPKQIEIGAIQDVERFGHGGASGGCDADPAGSRPGPGRQNAPLYHLFRLSAKRAGKTVAVMLSQSRLSR